MQQLKKKGRNVLDVAAQIPIKKVVFGIVTIVEKNDNGFHTLKFSVF